MKALKVFFGGAAICFSLFAVSIAIEHKIQDNIVPLVEYDLNSQSINIMGSPGGRSKKDTNIPLALTNDIYYTQNQAYILCRMFTCMIF